jgi:hypothetical protein
LLNRDLADRDYATLQRGCGILLIKRAFFSPRHRDVPGLPHSLLERAVILPQTADVGVE